MPHTEYSEYVRTYGLNDRVRELMAEGHNLADLTDAEITDLADRRWRSWDAAAAMFGWDSAITAEAENKYMPVAYEFWSRQDGSFDPDAEEAGASPSCSCIE